MIDKLIPLTDDTEPLDMRMDPREPENPQRRALSPDSF